MNKKIVDMKNVKQEMRVNLLATRRKLTKEVICLQSAKMAEVLYDWPCYQKAKTIMLFLSMPDEPNMMNVIEHAWQQGKTVCVPHMREQFGVMDAAVINNIHDLVQGRFNLLVPNPDHLQVIDPGLIDMIVVPGVAYDYAGNRLGMGAGYYDRFIPHAPQATLIGAIWSTHIVDSVPANQYDQNVQFLLSENGIMPCGTGKGSNNYSVD